MAPVEFAVGLRASGLGGAELIQVRTNGFPCRRNRAAFGVWEAETS